MSLHPISIFLSYEKLNVLPFSEQKWQDKMNSGKLTTRLLFAPVISRPMLLHPSPPRACPAVFSNCKKLQTTFRTNFSERELSTTQLISTDTVREKYFHNPSIFLYWNSFLLLMTILTKSATKKPFIPTTKRYLRILL